MAVPKHLTVKIVAVVLAFLLWVHVVTNKTYEHVAELPLGIVDIPEGLILASEVPETCEILVKSTGKELLRFLVEVHNLRITASEYSTGYYAVDLAPNDLIVDHMGSTEILEVVFPTKLRLQFEERLEKTIPVASTIEVKAALGYRKDGDLIITPDSIAIVGPKLVVRKMKVVQTEKLSFEDVNSSLEEQIRLTFPDSAYITLSDSSVLIKQKIVQLSERTFKDVPVRVRNKGMLNDFYMIPESVSITVEALSYVLDSISVEEFQVWIDVSEALPGSTFVTPEVTAPDGLRMVDVRPKEILIEVPGE